MGFRKELESKKYGYARIVETRVDGADAEDEKYLARLAADISHVNGVTAWCRGGKFVLKYFASLG